MSRRVLNRRRFFQSSAAGSVVMGVSVTRGAGNLQISAADGEGIEALLQRPPLDCRPMTRWWWYGGGVTEAGVNRDLMQMREAGIGGVEIQPVYPLSADDPGQGIINVPFFSDRWYELLAYAVSRGRSLGLRVELTLGSGWPFGGPFIPLGQAARRIRFLTTEFEGPGRFRWNPAQGLGEGERVARVNGRPADQPVHEPAPLVLETADLGSLREDGVPLDAGRWRFYAAIDAPTYMPVSYTHLTLPTKRIV